MKTGKKVILLTALAFMILAVVFLLSMRADIKSLMSTQLLRQYTEYQVDGFSVIHCSSNWQISVRQGNRWKLEISSDESDLTPTWEVKEGSLFLGLDSMNIPDEADTVYIHARITAPYLHLVEAKGNSQIRMRNFWADSLTIKLYDRAEFSGKNNDFTLIKFQSADK